LIALRPGDAGELRALPPDRFLGVLMDVLKAKAERSLPPPQRGKKPGRGPRKAKVNWRNLSLIGHMFHTRNRSDVDIRQKVAAVRKALRILNPRAKDLEVEFSTEARGNVLRLRSATGVRTIVPLAGLPLHALDISHSGVVRIECLRGTPLNHLDVSHSEVRYTPLLTQLPLKELRMAGCPKLKLRNLRSFPHLETLVVSADSPLLGRKVLNKASSRVRVIAADGP
jgi:hypothetical protein